MFPTAVAEQVAQSWRITGDHQDEWSNTKQVIQGFMAPSNPGRSYAWNYGAAWVCCEGSVARR